MVGGIIHVVGLLWRLSSMGVGGARYYDYEEYKFGSLVWHYFLVCWGGALEVVVEGFGDIFV